MISKALDLFGFEDSRERDKVEMSMGLVDDLRVSPFFPIEKVSHNSKLYRQFVANGNRHIRKTSWGELEIRNRLLTQSHLELFSTIMAHKKSYKQLKSGRIAIYFSMYEIAQAMGLEWSGRTSDELEERIRQIRDTVIVRRADKGNGDDYQILQNVDYSKQYDMWGIVLSDEYSELFRRGLTIGYKHRLGEIRAIKGKGSGLIKAIIHFFITHDQSKLHRISLHQLLETIGYPTDARTISTAVTALGKHKEELYGFSIAFYRKDRILEYSGTQDIQVIPALPLTLK
jgi:hypothetical protein